jgi:hypothetical protein
VLLLGPPIQKLHDEEGVKMSINDVGLSRAVPDDYERPYRPFVLPRWMVQPTTMLPVLPQRRPARTARPPSQMGGDPQ